MLKLHGFSVSNYANMVKHCLIEKGIEFEQIHAKPSQEPDFRAISPMGKIPCLETPQGCLIETSVILDYLEDVYPEPALRPTDPFQRARAGELIQVCELYIELSARRHLGSVMFGAEQSQAALDEVRPQVEKGLRGLKALASFDPFLLGDQFGNADIFAYHTFRLAGMLLQATYDWDVTIDLPDLAGFFAAVEARDSTRQVNADNETATAELMKMLQSS